MAGLRPTLRKATGYCDSQTVLDAGHQRTHPAKPANDRIKPNGPHYLTLVPKAPNANAYLQGEDINTKPLAKIIKKSERETPEVQAEIESGGGPNRWSTAVRSWVNEFQQDQRDEPVPALDSLFTDTLP